jgi:hypothetical protein
MAKRRRFQRTLSAIKGKKASSGDVGDALLDDITADSMTSGPPPCRRGLRGD